MAKVDRYLVAYGEKLRWYGTRTMSKHEVKNNVQKYTKLHAQKMMGEIADEMVLIVNHPCIFTVEFINQYEEDDGYTNYIFEVTTAEDRIIGHIDNEPDYFRNCGNYTYLGSYFTNDDNEEEEIL